VRPPCQKPLLQLFLAPIAATAAAAIICMMGLAFHRRLSHQRALHSNSEGPGREGKGRGAF